MPMREIMELARSSLMVVSALERIISFKALYRKSSLLCWPSFLYILFNTNGVLSYMGCGKASKMEEIKVAECRSVGQPSDWKYIAEGNLNIICSYIATDAKLKPFVLRIRKDTYSKAKGTLIT